jgi:hypothetical protein
MKRREFLTFVGSAAAWPVMAVAQQHKVPVVGILNSVHDDVVGHSSTGWRTPATWKVEI